MIKDKTCTIWETITIGNFADSNSLCNAIGDNGFYLFDWVEDVVRGSSVSAVKEEVDLVRVNLVDFRFSELEIQNLSVLDVYLRAFRLGLRLCTVEMGVQLCLQHRCNPMTAETLLVGMKPEVALNGQLKKNMRGILTIGSTPSSEVFKNFLGCSFLTRPPIDGCDDWVFSLPKKVRFKNLKDPLQL